MKRLSDAVAIKSVSAWTEKTYRDEIVKMVNHVKDVCDCIVLEIIITELQPVTQAIGTPSSPNPICSSYPVA